MMTNTTLSGISRVFLVLSALLIVTNLFLPVWRIELLAPQYPEGLALQIHADGLRGDVEIINGLNHYIGMKTLHSEDFFEFSILRYLFGSLAALFFVAALFGTRRWLYISLATLVVFGIIALVDFYRWNYNYGHDLDPNAAIKVPGMAYQPPVIGFKQLLNFGAYSIPDLGGWAMIGAALLLIVATAYEAGWLNRFRKGTGMATAGLLMILAGAGCGAPQPKALDLHTDLCAYCKMNVSDPRFAAQLVTAKGRTYMFDDIRCLRDYMTDQANAGDMAYVSDFCSPGQWVLTEAAILLESPAFQSPMGGNTAAFALRDSATVYQARHAATPVSWP